jgi:high-affinity iron transporter
MLAAAIIVFREIIEAGLIVGIVLAVTRGLPGSRGWIVAGVAAGVAGSCLVAGFTGAISQAFSGAGQELFNAAILAFAVVMLAWHNIWMASHGRELAGQLRQTGAAVSSGARAPVALAVVVGVAVLREGAEIVLFLYGIAVSGNTGWIILLTGGLIGLAAGIAFTMLTFVGLLTIPVRHLFSVTSALIALLAAGMAAQSTAFLEQAGIVDWLGATAWDTSHVLSEGSMPGRLLHTLIGYADQPSFLQVLVYIIVLGAILGGARFAAPKARPAASAPGVPASPR